MNVIKGLIIKDLSNIKSYKTTLLFFLIIFSSASFLNGNVTTFMPIFITLCFGTVAVSSFSYDNLANSDRYILSFPVNRKDIVKARYIYVILLTIAGAILGATVSIVLQTIKTGNVNLMDCISTSLGSIFGIMILQIVQLPIMYKFGAEKARIIQMITVVIIMSIIGFFIKISEGVFVIPKDYIILILGVMVILLYWLSYKISVKVYSKKEI